MSVGWGSTLFWFKTTPDWLHVWGYAPKAEPHNPDTNGEASFSLFLTLDKSSQLKSSGKDKSFIAAAMLDPLSAIGLASAIVQFIDFSGSLISETREIYGAGKGSLKQHEELAAITQDLKNLCQNLTPPQTRQAPSPSEDELALEEISKTCKDVAGEILLVLEKLKAKGKYEKFESFKTALKSALKREKIEEIKARIDRAQAQLQLRLIALIK